MAEEDVEQPELKLEKYSGLNKSWQGEKIPDLVKAEIAGRLLANENPMDLAKEYGISLASISRIKRTHINQDMLAKMNDARQGEIADMMGLSLVTSIEASIRIMEVTKDEAWLKNQKASDLGVMFGVIQDKQFRLLEAMQLASEVQGTETQNIDEEQ